jgi:hypothetical protein
MVFPEIDCRLDFLSEGLNFDLVPVKNHRLLWPVCFYAKHSSLFDLQSDLFSMFTAEITKVRSRIGFCAAGGSFRLSFAKTRSPLVLTTWKMECNVVEPGYLNPRRGILESDDILVKDNRRFRQDSKASG